MGIYLFIFKNHTHGTKIQTKASSGVDSSPYFSGLGLRLGP